MPKAVSYIRFSSASQGHGSTTSRQKALVDNWLELNKEVELSDLSVEDLGISGFKGKNRGHGLGKILDAIGENKIREGDFLLIEALDRLGRDEPLNMIKLCEEIISKGINIVTLDEGQVYSREEINKNSSVLQTLLGKIIQANNYSRQLSYRISEAYVNKRRKAINGEPIKIHNAYWLSKDGSLIPEKSNHVLFCIDLYLKGYGISKIFRQMINHYPETMSINPTTIKRWLENPALKGVWWNKGNPIENVFEPLVDKETFSRIKGEKDNRRRVSARQGVYALSGLFKCIGCGKNYHFRRKEYKGDVIVYCHCSTYLKKGKDFCTNKSSWPYEVVYTILEETLGDSLEKFTTKQVTDSLSLKLIEKEHEKESLEKQRNKAYKLITEDDGDDDFEVLKYKEIKTKLNKLASEIKEIELAISKESRIFLNTEQVNDANELYEKLVDDPVQLNSSLKKVGYEIVASKYRALVRNEKMVQIYKVLRRSQKFRCYVVLKTVVLLKENEKRIIKKYYAIDRKGVILISESFKKLMEALEHRKKDLLDNPAVYGDIDGHVSEEQIYVWLHGTLEARDYEEGRKQKLEEKLREKYFG